MKTRIVPAIDLLDGRCVRLQNGDFSRVEIVGDDPLSVAKQFEDMGFQRLHLVDLSGAKAGHPQHTTLLEHIASHTSLIVDYSGGLRSRDHIQRVIEHGARYVVIGSAAIKQPDDVKHWVTELGAARFILGFDVLHGTVRINGWQEETGVSLDDALNSYIKLGVTKVMSTDISKDGMLAGPGIELYRGIRARYPEIALIASGGVTSASDVFSLAQLGVSEVIVGKALYAGTLELREAKEFIW